MRRAAVGVLAGILIVGATPALVRGQQPGAAVQPQSPPTFKAGVEAVTVSASVRDPHGKVIQGLKQADFQVLDSGTPIRIQDFYVGESPISLAMLLDISGSMTPVAIRRGVTSF